MRQFILVLPISLCVLLMLSCAKKETATVAAQHATVVLRDGSRYAGSIVASSPSQVTLVGDDNHTRTLDMKDVRSIEYGDTQQAESDLNHENHYHPPESVISSKTYELPPGAEVSVRCEETIDSARAVEGQTYAAEVTRDVRDADGAIVIPRGSNAQIVIRSASKGGRFRGTSDLAIDLGSVSIDGRQYRLETAAIVRRGKPGVGANRRTAEFTGGGAAIGALIGAIAGHGKGAAIGAASGAGAGLTTQMITKGSAIRIPAETVLTFRLEQPLHVSRSE